MWHNPPRDGGRPLLRYGNTATFMFLNHFCMLFFFLPRFWGPSHASEGHLGLGPCVMRFFCFSVSGRHNSMKKARETALPSRKKTQATVRKLRGSPNLQLTYVGNCAWAPQKPPMYAKNYEKFTYLSKKAHARLPTEVCCNQESVGQGSGVGA